MVRCVRVPRSEGNTARLRIKSEGLQDMRHRIASEDGFLLIPILSDSYEDYEVCDRDLEYIAHKETDYRKLLPEEIRDILPSSYDHIGDVIIVKITDELLPYKEDIGSALLKTSSSARCVLMDSGVKGELRIRDLELIAGKGPSETRHRESGVTIMTDPSKVYYNPRLATERERIASLVKNGEIVIDMFAGVAPFPLTICRYAKPKMVYSIDLNSDAVKYARMNVKINGFRNITVLEGDARKVVKGLPMADRILMNLPQLSEEFLPDALSKLKKGGVVHMHKILERAESERFFDEIIQKMCARGLECELAGARDIKTYSPSASVYVLDIKRK